MKTIILGIESSCDETSASICIDGKVMNNIIATQSMHKEYGGVVPELASRAHQKNIILVVESALRGAKVKFSDLSAIAVTQGPGLLGALMVGYSYAKSLAFALDIPIINVNHMKAHILAHFIETPTPIFPFICLTVSGGHTQIVKVNSAVDMVVLGSTIDDAAGECVDKVAKLFGYPMPGGPIVDKAAIEFSGNEYDFPRPLFNKKTHNFSFSGLKTAMLRFKENYIQSSSCPEKTDEPYEIGPILASFFKSVTEVLIQKTFKAAEEHCLSNISVSGGLAASSKLRKVFEEESTRRGVKLYYPKPSLCTDNAAMVACLAAHRFEAGIFDDLSLDAFPNLQ